MEISEQHKQTIESSLKFFDETEELIKKAEHINDAMLVPAITELRYAGRKFVDYTKALYESESDEVVRSHIEDFAQCCIRARHDALDSIVTFISDYIDELEREVGADLVDAEFPNRTQLLKAVEDAETRIRSSRKERYKRNELYSEINDKFVDKIIKHYNTLRRSQTVIFAKRARRDREHKFAVLAIVFGIVSTAGLVVGGASLLMQISGG